MGGISVFMKDNCFVDSRFDEDEKAEEHRQFERGNVLDISQKNLMKNILLIKNLLNHLMIIIYQIQFKIYLY